MTTLARLLAVSIAAAVPLLLTRAPDAPRSALAATITEVAPGVFFAETSTRPEFLGSNTGFVVLEDEVVVIDASFPVTARALLDEIRARTDRPVRFAFDTHWHPDHAFGNDVFAQAGAVIVAQRRCLDEQRERAAPAFAEHAAAKDSRRRMVEGAAWRAATVAFDDRLVLDDGSRRVELLHFGRAHTRGDAVAWLPREGVLFTGDVAVNGAFNYMGDADTSHWIEVLDRLIALKPKVVCPGHGPAGGPELLELQKRWLVELRAAVTSGLASGAEPDAIRDGLELPWYEAWTGVPAKTREENVRRVHDELTGIVPPPSLTDDLGLTAWGARPRDASGWSAPKKVVVAAAWAQRGPAGGLDALRRVAPGIELVAATSAAEAAKLAADADGVIGFASEPLLSAAPKLRWVQVGSAGVERYIGLSRIASGEVVLTNAQRLYGPEIADHAVGMLLALTRAIPAALENQRATRKWELPAAARDAMVELRGKTVLVAGFGGIGREIAERVAAFGARVLATQARPSAPPAFVERIGPPEDLLDMAAQSDVVFVCVPLTPQTERLFDEEFFDRVKRGAWFVNVARGRCVDTPALVAALQDGRLAGAGLDVTDPEPLPADHELWKLPNVIVTPHDAATSDGADERLFLLVRENLRRFAAGEALLSVVEPSIGH